MIGGALKLGAAIAGAYFIGGKLGEGGLKLASATPSADALTAAKWGGRAATFLIIAAVLR